MEPLSLPNVLYQFSLLAQGFQAMGSHFQSNGGGTGSSGAALFLGAVVLVVVLILVSRYANPTGPHRSPRRLFRELCAAHDLSRKERRLLRRLARRHYKPPQEAFIHPDFFRLPEGDPASPDPVAAEVNALGQRLFGSALR